MEAISRTAARRPSSRRARRGQQVQSAAHDEPAAAQGVDRERSAQESVVETRTASAMGSPTRGSLDGAVVAPCFQSHGTCPPTRPASASGERRVPDDRMM